MPSIEVLEQFKSLVNELGNEAEILESRNETIPDIARPESSDDSGDGSNEMNELLKHYTEDLENLEKMAVDDFDEGATVETPIDEDDSSDLTEVFPSELNEQEGDEAAEYFSDPSITPGEPLQDLTEDSAELPDEDELDVLTSESTGIPEEFLSEDMVSNEAVPEVAVPESSVTDDLIQDVTPLDLDDINTADMPDIDLVDSQLADKEENYDISSFGNFDDPDNQSDEVNNDESESNKQEFLISEEEFISIRNTLLFLPRNLKMAIEQLFADEVYDTETIQPLIQLCIDNGSPNALAKEFYKITKRRIEIPRNYRKLSGQSFEKKQSSLLYTVFREGRKKILKLLLIVFSIWLLFLVSFNWMYRPLQASLYYNEGRNLIAQDEIDKATDYFNYAWNGWPLFSSPEDDINISTAPLVIKGWKNRKQWLVYARDFRRRKHWNKTREFYEGSLIAKPKKHKIRVEYARFLSNRLGEYQHAISILDSAPEKLNSHWEEEFILEKGDVYYEWAQDNPSMYEKVRFFYALALERNANNERALLSMMRYFLKLNSREEIRRLIPMLDKDVSMKISNPALAAVVYSDLAVFLMQEESRFETMKYISLAKNADSMAPEPWFANALFQNREGNTVNERDSYIRVLSNLENREYLTRNQLRIRILSLAGIGRYYNHVNKTDLAIKNYNQAVALYEDAIKRNQIGGSPEFGQMYLELGNIHYYNKADAHRMQFTLEVNPVTETYKERLSELEKAFMYYNLADDLLLRGMQESGLPDRELFRRAYAGSILGKDSALVDAYRIVRRQPDNYDTRIALGTMLLKSGDYTASRLQYNRALELMDQSLERYDEIFEPEVMESHKALLYRYVAVWNNLGVDRAMSVAGGGNNEDYAAALTAFTMSSEYLDRVQTNMTDMIQSGAVGLRDEDSMKVVDRTGNLNFPREKITFPYRNRLRLLGKEQPPNSWLIYTDIPSDT